MPREGGREDNRPVAHTVSSPLTLGSIGFEPDEVHHVLAETAAIQLDHPAVVPTTTSIYINWNDLNINKFGLYGTIYLLAADSLLYPIDLFTTRLQADKMSSQKGLHLRRLMASTIKNEGLKGIYRGFLPAMCGSFPGQCIYYPAYEWTNSKTNEFLQFHSTLPTWLREFLARTIGGYAGDLFSASVYLPTDIISQRLQIERKVNFLNQKFTYRNSLDIMRHIWKTEGLLGFYRGLGPYVFVFGSASAIWWTSYESLKSHYYNAISTVSSFLVELGASRMIPGSMPGYHDDTWSLPASQFAAGLCAGALSLLFSNPLDVARTRLQLLESANPKEAELIRKGYFHILSTAFKQEGFRGLYKGFKPRLLMRLPGSALKVLGYEFLKKLSKEDSSLED